jgi:gluconokinase
MGVAGSGKTTIGRMVADALGWPYFEADDFHSPENKAKMSRGQPLTDADREPWLTDIRAKIDECRSAGRNAVFTCSALKEQYRTRLGLDQADTILVHLTGDLATILARVTQRQGHYLKAALVESQFKDLEPPSNALTCDVALPPEEIVRRILQRLNDG